MNLYEAIFLRKSVRNYEMEVISPEILQEIQEFYAQIEGLNPGIRTEISICLLYTSPSPRDQR